MDDFQPDTDDSKRHASIQCAPSPSPFKPCDYLFESWIVRLGVWVIVVISVVSNGVVILTVFASPGYLSPVKFVVGSIAASNFLTGIYCGILAFVDVLTFGQFAKFGVRWETGMGCKITGFVSVFASEASILLLTLAAVQCSISVSCVRVYGKSLSFSSVKTAALCSVILSSLAATLPLLSIGEYGATPLCLPYALPEIKSSSLGFMVTLVMMNTLCFLIITGTYIRLYCNLLKGEFDTICDCTMIKHVAWLIFTNCLLYCPVAFLTFSSTLNLFLITPEVMKSVLLVLLPLPASLNPLLYLLFNPHFKDDVRLLRQSKCVMIADPPLYISEDIEKTSYDSTQALVAVSDGNLVFKDPKSVAAHTSHSLVLSDCSFPPVTLIPCQQNARREEQEHPSHNSCQVKDKVFITSESLETTGTSIRISYIHNPSTHSFTAYF